MNLLCILSSVFPSFLCSGDQNCTQTSRCYIKLRCYFLGLVFYAPANQDEHPLFVISRLIICVANFGDFRRTTKILRSSIFFRALPFNVYVLPLFDLKGIISENAFCDFCFNDMFWNKAIVFKFWNLGPHVWEASTLLRGPWQLRWVDWPSQSSPDKWDQRARGVNSVSFGAKGGELQEKLQGVKDGTLSAALHAKVVKWLVLVTKSTSGLISEGKATGWLENHNTIGQNYKGLHKTKIGLTILRAWQTG